MTMMIDYTDFYYWSDPFRSKPVRLSRKGKRDLAWVSSVCHGEIIPSEPVALVPDSGSLWEDILWTNGEFI
jgi:hypothetical protein